MVFAIDRDQLLDHLLIIQKGLPTKTPMPALFGIKFELFEDYLLMTSSNTDIAIQVLSDDPSLSITKTGRVVIPGRYLIEIIRRVTSKRIEFALIDDRLLVIKADRSE
ncbi:MAG: DNA polymerase III subunit beta, partial [Acholeplasmataceae bacterium]